MFTVIELQTSGNTTSVLSTNFVDINQAYQKYHQILSYAAVSELDIHTAIVVDERGYELKQEFYEHGNTPDVSEE